MNEQFDAYYEWLGIRPKDQPPNHYRLLGLEPLEPNADVIDRMADARMAYLRTFQAGEHAAHSQRLLNEVAAARICLLDNERKRAYDDQLRRELERKLTPLHLAPPAGQAADPAAGGQAPDARITGHAPPDPAGIQPNRFVSGGTSTPSGLPQPQRPGLDPRRAPDGPQPRGAGSAEEAAPAIVLEPAGPAKTTGRTAPRLMGAAAAGVGRRLSGFAAGLPRPSVAGGRRVFLALPQYAMSLTRFSLGSARRSVLGVDWCLGRMAGPGNGLLHGFLRVICILLLLGGCALGMLLASPGLLNPVADCSGLASVEDADDGRREEEHVSNDGQVAGQVTGQVASREASMRQGNEPGEEAPNLGARGMPPPGRFPHDPAHPPRRPWRPRPFPGSRRELARRRAGGNPENPSPSPTARAYRALVRDAELFYSFDEKTLSTTDNRLIVLDESGNGLRGVLHECASAAGRFGECVRFGGRHSHVALGDVLNDVKLPVTIAMWCDVRGKRVPECALLETDHSDTLCSGFGLFLNRGKRLEARWGAADRRGAPRDRRSGTGRVPAPLLLRSWTHVVAVMQADRTFRLIVNGNQQPMHFSGTAEDVGFTAGGGFIGRGLYGGLDEVGLWSRELSAEEISVLYNGGP